MAAKQPQAKKQASLPVRSVMLTRFKLSQQKRQLREKERRIAQSVPQSKGTPPSPKTPEDKKLNSTKTVSPSKSGKRDPVRRVLKDSVEFQPEKPHRRKPSKKIVLKPRHELKVIGGNGSGSCKRKLNVPQKGTKPPPAKRKKSSHGLDFGPAEPDRSRSPIYSELGFEEVIRMVDENYSLDDDDLLEILTCPSPVWWEDPPDDDYMEGPIIEMPKITGLPAIAEKNRSRTARKKTPHKIILEPVESTDNNKKEDKKDTETEINAATAESINKTDDKFKNKRSKLESLLTTIKDKLNASKCQYDSEKTVKESVVKDFTDNNSKLIGSKSTNDRNKSNRSRLDSDIDTSDDISFADISQQDKDLLKHLENIEIPIEDKNTKLARKTEGKLEIKTQTDARKIAPYKGSTKVLLTSKNFPKFCTNKKLKILNIKKLFTNGPQKNFSGTSILSEQRKSTEKINTKTDTKLSVNQLDKTNCEINQNHDNGTESDINNKNNHQNPLSVEKHNFLSKNMKEESETVESIHKSKLPSKESPSNTEEFVTVFKIISNITDNTNNVKARHLAEEKEELKEEIPTESDVSDREAKTLDSYYKKCKSRKRESIKAIVTEDTEAARDNKQEREDVRSEENIKELCDSCDKDSKMSIIVPSTTDVRYCLKCSSIFDLEECNYCIRKEKQRERRKTQEKSHESEDVDSIDVQNSINRHYV